MPGSRAQFRPRAFRVRPHRVDPFTTTAAVTSFVPKHRTSGPEFPDAKVNVLALCGRHTHPYWLGRRPGPFDEESGLQRRTWLRSRSLSRLWTRLTPCCVNAEAWGFLHASAPREYRFGDRQMTAEMAGSRLAEGVCGALPVDRRRTSPNRFRAPAGSVQFADTSAATRRAVDRRAAPSRSSRSSSAANIGRNAPDHGAALVSRNREGQASRAAAASRRRRGRPIVSG